MIDNIDDCRLLWYKTETDIGQDQQFLLSVTLEILEVHKQIIKKIFCWCPNELHREN